MKQYLLDTNICIFFLRGLYDVPQRLEQIGRRNCHISEITVGELLYGAACSIQKEKHLRQVNELISLFAVEPIYPVLPVFADTKAQLRKQGTMIDDRQITFLQPSFKSNALKLYKRTSGRCRSRRWYFCPLSHIGIVLSLFLRIFAKSNP